MSDDLIPIPDPSESPMQLRQTARLEDVPEIYRKTHERLAVELAMHVDDAAEIFARYGYSDEQAAELVESPSFVMLMQQMSKEVQTSGLSFKTKAQLIAGELLPYANELATDPMISAAVRLSSIQWVAKMAGFEPKETKDDSKTGGGLTLSITFAGQAPQQVVSSQHEPLTITQGD